MKFRCEQYPQLKVGLAKGGYVSFADGEVETDDKAAIEALKALPDEYGVKPVSTRAAKAADKGEK